MKIIDTHLHAISSDTQTYPTAPIGGHQSDWSRKRPVDVAGVLRSMDEAGIAKAVVVQASTVYGHDNRYVVEAVRAHPDRFAGVYSIDALGSDAVAQIDRWQAEGLSGLRLFTTGSTMPGQSDWLGHKDSFRAWAHAEALGIPLCLQMTMEGLPALRSLLERFPKVRVLIMSGLPEAQYARNVLRAGASGYLSKGGSPEELLKAVRTVLVGRRYVSASLAESMAADLESTHDQNQPLHERLSVREFQIFGKLAAGAGVGEIADELSLSVKTVSTYRSRILEKMNFNSNADMTAYALRNGLIL